MSDESASRPVNVERLMTELEDDVRRARRKRLLARGGAADYHDADLYEKVDVVLRRALDARDHDALLLPDLLTDEQEWRLSLHLKWASHRSGVVGPFLIFVKRRLLLPMFWWLWEYSLENFRTQRRVNAILFACVEELAIENARLRQAIEGRHHPSARTTHTHGDADRHDTASPDPAMPGDLSGDPFSRR